MKKLNAKMLLASLALAPLTAIPAASLSAQSSVSPQQDITLSIGKGQLINVAGKMADVFIADDKIADVQVKSQKQLYIFGKTGGDTTVYASDVQGNVIWSANVRVGSNISSVDQMLKLAMPEADIAVATMSSNTVLLTGTISAPEDAAEAERLVKAYMGENANVISRLKMATPLQVNLKVRFAEVSRSLVRTLGVNLNSMDGTSGIQGGVATGRSAFPTYRKGGTFGGGRNPTDYVPDINNPGTMVEEAGTAMAGAALGGTFGLTGKFLGLDLLGALDLAERDGLVTTLSQPNLTALSGETAEFLAGGEFPIPMRTGVGGEVSVQYRKFGVSLAYTPTVLANGRISIRVKPEVSELSSQGSVTLNGFQIPGLTIRRAETTVELGSGQSFMIAGLMSNSSQNAIDKAPGVGDVPILGNLFRSTEFRRGESELVIVVTPYLVKPVNDSDISLPTDGLVNSDEARRTLGFRQNRNTGGSRPKPTVNGVALPGDPQQSQLEPADMLASGEKVKKKKEKKKKSHSDDQSSEVAAANPGFNF